MGTIGQGSHLFITLPHEPLVLLCPGLGLGAYLGLNLLLLCHAESGLTGDLLAALLFLLLLITLCVLALGRAVLLSFRKLCLSAIQLLLGLDDRIRVALFVGFTVRFLGLCQR